MFFGGRDSGLGIGDSDKGAELAAPAFNESQSPIPNPESRLIPINPQLIHRLVVSEDEMSPRMITGQCSSLVAVGMLPDSV